MAPPKGLLPPLKFEKTIERTVETIDYCFKKLSIVFCPPPPKFFSSRKPGFVVCDGSLYGLTKQSDRILDHQIAQHTSFLKSYVTL